MAQESAARRQAIRQRETLSKPPGAPRWQSSTSLLERLIDAEVLDLESQRIHADELVWHVVAQDEVHLRDICFAAPFGPRTWRVEDLLERDSRLERRRTQFAQAHVLNGHLDLVGGGVRHEH